VPPKARKGPAIAVSQVAGVHQDETHHKAHRSFENASLRSNIARRRCQNTPGLRTGRCGTGWSARQSTLGLAACATP
jgi:hypothetical protein